MGTDRSRDTYRGLVYHDPRLTSFWDAETSCTQAGPVPGDPEAQQDTEMVLESSGTQAADSTLRVQSLRGGLPGPGPMRAGRVYRLDDVGDWRGWEVPTTALGWEAVAWTDGTGTIPATYHPHAVTLDNGTILVAVQAVHTVGLDTTYEVRVYIRDPDSGAWGSVVVYSQDAIWTDGLYPCLVVLPSGRVLCYHWIEDYDTSPEEAQVRVHYSDDSGATWTQGRSYVLEDAVSVTSVAGAGNAGFELGRLRGAYDNGQVSLVGALVANNTTPTYRATLVQWASFDEGMSFETVSATWDTSVRGGGSHDVIALPSGFGLFYLSTVDMLPYLRIIGHASESYEDAAEIAVAAGTEVWATLDGSSQYFTDADLAACLDEDGAIYVYGRQPTVAQQGLCTRSIDGGATWAGMGHSPYTSGLSAWWYAADTSTYPCDFAATCQRGRVVLAHNWAANPGNEDNSLGALYLGGNPTVTMPGTKAMPTDLDRVPWTRTWLPFDIPSDVGWAAAGAGVVALASGALNITTAAALQTYSINPSGTIDEGLIVRAVVTQVAGGSVLSDAIRLRLRLADGVDDYDVSIRVASDSFRAYDNNAGAALGTIVVDTTAGIEFLVAMAGYRIVIWYRPADNDEDKVWKDGPTSGALVSDVATPQANHLVSFGHGAGSTAESDWTEVHYAHDEWTGLISTLVDGWTNPDDLAPRNLSISPVYLADGVRIAALDGPTVEGDEWHIDTAYEWGLLNLLRPDPRIGWRSEDDASAATIALAFDDTLLGTEDSGHGNDVIALGIFGANFGTATLYGYDAGTSAFVSLGTVNLAHGLDGLHWERNGNTVRPANTDGTCTPYLHFQEFAGGSFRPDTTSKIRRISWHTEGRFGGAVAAKLPTLTLKDADGTEGASGTDGEIWSPDVVMLVKLNGASYAGYALEIPAQDTVDGFFQAGTIILGPAAIFGADYSWGRACETTPNTETRRARDGHRTTRPLGLPARIEEFSWIDGLDTTDIWEDTEPDYVLASTSVTAEPAASVADVPQLVEGLTRLLYGPDRRVIYLPSIPKAGTTVTLVRREELLLGSITSPIRIEAVQGEELSDEVVRVATVTIEEEPPRDWRSG